MRTSLVKGFELKNHWKTMGSEPMAGAKNEMFALEGATRFVGWRTNVGAANWTISEAMARVREPEEFEMVTEYEPASADWASKMDSVGVSAPVIWLLFERGEPLKSQAYVNGGEPAERTLKEAG